MFDLKSFGIVTNNRDAGTPSPAPAPPLHYLHPPVSSSTSVGPAWLDCVGAQHAAPQLGNNLSVLKLFFLFREFAARRSIQKKWRPGKTGTPEMVD
jgi:hypothetical protein